MTQKDLLDALRNERRQPVDLNLGQVPVSPTIGRMGNYNVVVPGYSRRNAASELSTALSQLPQIAGQFRNIQEQAGVEEANSLTTEEVIKRVNAGDMEAKGFLAQFGKDKAFAEQLYQRTYESVIKPAFIKTAGEIDNMTAEEIAKIGNEEQFREYAKNKLVASISEDNPDLLKNIKSNPYQASMHNKAMDGAVPSFVEEANAKAVARKLEFTETQAKQTLSNNLFSRADVTLEEYEWNDNKSFTQNTALGLQHGVKQRKDLIDYYQDSINTLSAEASLDGVDDIEQEKIIQDFFRSKITLLVDQEEIDHANVLKDAIDTGDLTVNGRAFKHTKEGTDTLRIVESSLQSYQDKIDRENERDDVNKVKINEFLFNNVDDRLADLYALPDPTPEQYDTTIEDFKNQRASLDTLTGFSGTEKRTLSKGIYDAISELELKKEGLSDRTAFWENKSEVQDLKNEFGFLGSTHLDTYAIADLDIMSGRAKELGLEDMFNSLAPQVRNPVTFKMEYKPNPVVAQVASVANEMALVETLQPILEVMQTKRGMETLALKANPAFSNEDKLAYRQHILEKFQENYNTAFANHLKKVAEDNNYIPGETPIDAPKPSGRKTEKQIQQEVEKIAPLKDGKIVYEFKREALSEGDYQLTGRTLDRRRVNTDSAWRMVTDSDAVKAFRDNNTIVERTNFNTIYQRTKFTYEARISRAKALHNKPKDKYESAKAWEVQQSEVFGLPLPILLDKNGLDGISYEPDIPFYKSPTFFGTLFFDKPDKVYESIDYDLNKSLTGPSAPSKRLFNLPALQDVLIRQDYTNLLLIAKKFGHAPQNATKNHPKIKSFLKQQLKVAERYGWYDVEDNPTQEQK